MTDREELVEQIRREVTEAAEAVGAVTGSFDLEQQITSAANICAPQLAEELMSTQGNVALRAAHEIIAAVWGPDEPTSEWRTTPLGLACGQALGRSAREPIVVPDTEPAGSPSR